MAPRPDDSAAEVAARLAAIVQSSDDAIIGKTFEGVVTSWNPAAERMFGWTADEAVGRHIRLIVPPERWAEEEDVLARIRRGEIVDHFETVRVTRSGERRDVSLTVSPIRDGQGRVVGASKIARDITERTRAEAERAALRQRAEEARAEAEAASRSKDEFLAVLSHELRSPLNAIFGWARLLDDRMLDTAMTARAIEAIRRNAEAQVRLVEDLLDVSRMITGNLRLELRPLGLRGVVEAALDAVRPAAGAKGVRLEAVLDDPGPVMGAAERLQQVVWNLLINAVKFTPRGGRVRIALGRGDSQALVVVSDTGQGIAPELLPLVFERFRQGDSGSTRAHGGLGIGLALVRHLVDLHGGSVTAESPGPGQGATFTVRLPLAIVAADPPAALPQAAAAAAERLAPPAGAPPSLRGVRVLLVDDDPDGLELAGVILTNCGAAVRSCASAAAARDALRSWLPDVAVLDLELPGEDADMLLRRLRALAAGHGARLPALALTAYGRPADRTRALAAGFNLHLARPVDPTELVLAVASLSGRTD